MSETLSNLSVCSGISTVSIYTFDSKTCGTLSYSSKSMFDLDKLSAGREDGERVAVCTSIRIGHLVFVL